MTDEQNILALSPEEQSLWNKVNSMWEWLKNEDSLNITNSLHPDYVGWDMSTSGPHNRIQAVQSVIGGMPKVSRYKLKPVSVKVYDNDVGVAHYSYEATFLLKEGPELQVDGRWSEVYLKKDDQWVLITLSGRPDHTAVGHQGLMPSFA